MRSKIVQVKSARANATAKMAQMSQKSMAATKALEKMVTTVREQVEEEVRQNSAISTRIQSVTDAVTSAEERAKLIEVAVKNLEMSHNHTKGAIGNLSSRIEKIEKVVEEVKSGKIAENKSGKIAEKI